MLKLTTVFSFSAHIISQKYPWVSLLIVKTLNVTRWSISFHYYGPQRWLIKEWQQMKGCRVERWDMNMENTDIEWKNLQGKKGRKIKEKGRIQNGKEQLAKTVSDFSTLFVQTLCDVLYEQQNMKYDCIKLCTPHTWLWLLSSWQIAISPLNT